MNLNCAGVESVLAQLQELYGAERFSQIFKVNCKLNLNTHNQETHSIA